jgi:hypothetical protein
LTRRLDEVLKGETAGDPMSAVKWTRKSTRSVSRALRVSHTTAWRMLRAAKYRLRFNRKRLTRKSSPDRQQQFAEIERLKASFARRGQPIVSVDAKKRELVGRFKNPGRAWRKTPLDVSMYDFPSDADGVAIPYGIYDVSRGDGFVVVGTSHNTPAFAAHAVHKWWSLAGRAAHAGARELLCRGSRCLRIASRDHRVARSAQGERGGPRPCPQAAGGSARSGGVRLGPLA